MTVPNPNGVPFDTDPSEWTETDGKAVVFRDSDGNDLVTFFDYYLLDPETGDLEPAHPPEQPGAATAEIASEVPNDMPDAVTKHEEVTL